MRNFYTLLLIDWTGIFFNSFKNCTREQSPFPRTVAIVGWGKCVGFGNRTMFPAMWSIFSTVGARGKSMQSAASWEQLGRRAGIHFPALHTLPIGQNCARPLRSHLLPVGCRGGRLPDHGFHWKSRIVFALPPRIQLFRQFCHLHLERYVTSCM